MNTMLRMWGVSVAIGLAHLAARGGAAESVAVGAGSAPAVEVRVDERVELMSLVFRLAGNREYNQGAVALYLQDVEKHFAAFKDHEVVALARRLRNTRGVSYDAVMSFAVHVDAQLKPLLPLDPRPPTLDGRWRPEEAARFLERLRDFAEVSGFNGFFTAHRTLYETAAARMQAVMKEADLGWFDRFFGVRPGARFEVVLGMLNGGACYGASTRVPGEPERLYCVLGVWATDAEGQPKFDRTMLPTVVHEFAHAFVNPLVYAREDELRAAGEILYPAVAEAMRAQAYGNWTTMMHESLVRASVVRYQQAMDGEAAVRWAIRQEETRSFRWMPELVKLLGEYEAQREQYPDFASFFPRIVGFFSEAAPIWVERLREEERNAPKVESMIPANGDRAVDPELGAIVVVFDRAMGGGYSFVGGGEKYPKAAGQPSFDAARRTVTWPVRLEPERDYEFWLNRNEFRGFRSAEGIPLKSVPVRFRTGPGK